jgi:hypothetical protein
LNHGLGWKLRAEPEIISVHIPAASILQRLIPKKNIVAITLFLRTAPAILAVIALLPAAIGQTGSSQVQAPTRAEALAAERDAKATTTLTLAKPEQIYYRVLKNPFVRGFLTPESGLSVRFGGLYPGSSFAMGLNYTKNGLLNDNVNFSAFASGSVRLYYAAGVLISAPHLATDRVEIDYLLRRTYAPQMPYYGPGNRSSEATRSNYLQEDVLNSARIGYKPFRRYLSLGVMGGIQQFNIGHGTSGDYPSTEDIFGPQQAPGVDRQANYTQLGPFAVIDYTDDSANPHSGRTIRSPVSLVSRLQVRSLLLSKGAGLGGAVHPFSEQETCDCAEGQIRMEPHRRRGSGSVLHTGKPWRSE